MFPGPGGWRDGVGLLVGQRRQAREHLPQVLVGIEPQPPAVLDDREQHGAPFPGVVRSNEQPVLLADGRGPDHILDQVVVEFHPAVGQEHLEPGPLVQGVTMIL